jgi:hypothetical protein
MQLKDFVAETLKQIIQGVTEAQNNSEIGFINPADYKASSTIGNGRKDGRFAEIPGKGVCHFEIQDVDFDVAVTVTEGTGTTGTIGIAGAISQESFKNSESASETVSRIKFKVPVVFPHHPGTNPQTDLLKKK